MSFSLRQYRRDRAALTEGCGRAGGALAFCAGGSYRGLDRGQGL